jgi:peptidoglycan L-alanyl-D-glutamate endopeptidase CwlK
MSVIKQGDTGPGVEKLQQRLVDLGFDPGPVNGEFGDETRAAVIGFQKSVQLKPDGVVGPRTQLELDPGGLEPPPVLTGVTLRIVARMFPTALLVNIRTNLPIVLTALIEPALTDKPMVLMALSTIRAETAGFEPISEGRSHFNTSPGGRPFDLYDNRADLGNLGPPDGDTFKGRGFVQLTGRSNYQIHGQAIGVDLIAGPDLANDPGIAAKLLGSFLKSKEDAIRTALEASDLAHARKLVNGGVHGLASFTDAFNIGNGRLPDDIAVVIKSAAGSALNA